MKPYIVICLLITGIILHYSCDQYKFLGPAEMFTLSDDTSSQIPNLIKANGIYKLEGYEEKTYILNFAQNYLSIHSSDLRHSILKAARTQEGIIFKGYSKPMLSATEFVKTEIYITEEQLNKIISNNIGESLKFDCQFGRKKSELILEKEFLEKEFIIFGHRGGGIAGYSIPAPENSLEIIALSNLYGANGVEIDIRVTKDNIPILFHDETITPRTVESQIVMGKVNDFYFSHIEYYCRLYNGEKIPSLEKALDYILNNTSLKYVWLDCKTKELENIMLIQKTYNLKAKSLNRDLIIFIGLPDDEIFQSYMNSPLKADCPSICELSPEKAIESNSKIWSQRWTQGINNEKIDMLLQKGIITAYWPVNDQEVLNTIIRNTNTKAVITDYPQFIYYLLNEK